MRRRDYRPLPDLLTIVLAPEGQIQFETRSDGRTLTGTVYSLAEGHLFRPYRWMDPAREQERRTLPPSLRKLISARTEAPETTTAA
jgi:hypothetical protein